MKTSTIVIVAVALVVVVGIGAWAFTRPREPEAVAPAPPVVSERRGRARRGSPSLGDALGFLRDAAGVASGFASGGTSKVGLAL